jgi:hypothetical protein
MNELVGLHNTGGLLHTTALAAPRYPAYRGKRVLTLRGCGRSYRGLLSVKNAGARVLGVYCGARMGGVHSD